MTPGGSGESAYNMVGLQTEYNNVNSLGKGFAVVSQDSNSIMNKSQSNMHDETTSAPPIN